ncbi:MAG: hypothetical protein ACKOBT_02740 [Actinomycetota bacterium]
MFTGRTWIVAAVLVGATACGSPIESSTSVSTSGPASTSRSLGSRPTTSSASSSEGAVAASFDALMMRRIECGRRPRTCDVDALAVVGSPLHGRLAELMAQRRAAEIVASRRGSLRYRIDGVDLQSPDRASVTTCLTDDTVLVSGGAVFDESLFSARSIWTMQRVDDVWLWVDDEVLEWRNGEDLCAFET